MFCKYVIVVLLAAVSGGAVMGSLQDKQTDLGLKVFGHLAEASAHRNVLFSPYGVSSVLAMAQLGAAGNTHKAMTAAMGFSLQGTTPRAVIYLPFFKFRRDAKL